MFWIIEQTEVKFRIGGEQKDIRVEPVKTIVQITEKMVVKMEFENIYLFIYLLVENIYKLKLNMFIYVNICKLNVYTNALNLYLIIRVKGENIGSLKFKICLAD